MFPIRNQALYTLQIIIHAPYICNVQLNVSYSKPSAIYVTSLHWQLFICSPNTSLFNVGKPTIRVPNIHQWTNEPDVFMHQGDTFCMNRAVVAHLHHCHHGHFSRFLQGPQSFSSNPHVQPSSIIHLLCHQLTDQFHKTAGWNAHPNGLLIMVDFS